MSQIRTFIDGRNFITNSPFRSVYFCVASAIGFIAIVIDAFLIYKYWRALNTHYVISLGALIGVQLIYQWWRAWRYYSKIRELYSMKPKEEALDGSPLDAALRVASGGLIDILFYSYGTAIVALILIGVLLKHFQR